MDAAKPPTPTEPPPPVHQHPQMVILRPWPKVIFFYPTMLAALIVAAIVSAPS